MAQVELFRSARLLVRHVPAEDASRIIVTFDNLQADCPLDRPGFGEAYLAARGIAAIHVLGAGNDWYQYPEMAEAAALIRGAVAGAARVMAYGSSMGGYAAIRLADAVGADAILALSPQYAIELATVPFERRWTDHAARIVWLAEARGPIRAAAPATIAYDPRTADGLHAALIGRDIATRPLALPWVGHPATTFLANVGLLGPLLFAVLDDTLDPRGFLAEAHARRRTSAAYLAVLALRQLESRPRLAAALARRALEIEADHATALTALGRALSVTGAHEQALATHARAIASTAGHPDQVFAYIEALAEAGETRAALAETDALIGAWPDRPHLHGFKAHLLWQLWQEDAAFAAVARARAIDPDSIHHAASQAYYEAERAKRDAKWRRYGGARARRRWQPLVRRIKGWWQRGPGPT